jgi:multidrug resistance efflux pump
MTVKRKKWLIIGGALALLLLGVAVTSLVWPGLWQPVLAELRLAEPEATNITASGFIEAEEVSIAPEVGGRIVEIYVAEGDAVEAGQVLVELDAGLIQAQVVLAQAGLEVAEATLNQIRAGARPEQIRQAEAAVAQAEAARDGAYQGWQDTLALVDSPQELDAQIALAQAQVNEAEAGLRQAASLRDVATIANDAFSGATRQYPPGQSARILVADGSIADVLPGLPQELVDFLSGQADGTYSYRNWEITLSGGSVTIYQSRSFSYPLDAHLIPNAYWQAWVGYNTAQAAYDGAQRVLNVLYGIRSNPQELQTQVDAAEAQYQAALAALEMAEAQLDGLQAGATEEEFAAAEAQTRQAQAELDSALVLLEKLSLEAPSSGWILDTVGHAGELATPGVPLVTLADLDEVSLTIYVPENRLGQVQIGQQVEVRVDSFPDQVFVGRVATIASEAEFTPRNVQTEEERVNMVFAVKVTIPNPDQVLKPGMPADAVILVQES